MKDINQNFRLDSYNYDLSEEYIAQIPVKNSKLLLCDWWKFSNKSFSNLPWILNKETVMFFNNSKVYNARIPLEKRLVIRHSGYKNIIDWEIFVYQILWKNKFEWLSSDGKNFKPWSKIFFENNIIIRSMEFCDEWIIFEIEWCNIYSFLEKNAQSPLPPYISYDKSKEKYYQTIFAENLWSAAAPTASLHFDQKLLNKLKEKNIECRFETLHVWLGTFKPVFSQDIREHPIHEEDFLLRPNIFEEIYKIKSSGKKILAVGTTMARFLETLPFVWKKYNSKFSLDDDVKIFFDGITKNIELEEANKFCPMNIENINWNNEYTQIPTKLFIYPWFERKLVDQLITNFHLPRSSLLMLVSSFMGRKNVLESYEYAKNSDYRFYSFGDGMLVVN